MKLASYILIIGFLFACNASDVVEEPEIEASADLVPETITKTDEVESEEPIGKGLRVAPIEKEFEEEEIKESKISYRGSQLWRVILDSKDKKRLVAKLRDNKDISLWGGNQTATDVLVKEDCKDKILKQFNANTIKYEVIIDDIQKAIDEENPKSDEDEEVLQNRQGHKMTWTNYHRVEDMHRYLDFLAETYPQLVSVQVIGSSVKGRPLKVIKISNGRRGNNAIWVDGGMHAREWISPASVSYIINHLVNNFENEPQELQNLDWYILPIANPDGYEYSHEVDRLWRKNRARSGQCAGTDLNRNFGYQWGGKGSGHYVCGETYAGTGPFSEPETGAIENFIKHTKANWQGYVSFHSYGQYILYPWGYDRLITTDHQELTAVARAAAQAISQASGSHYTIGPAGSTLYPASGGSDDWAKGGMGMKYAFTIELRDTGRHGFILPAAYIQPTAKEAFAALSVIAKAVSTV